MSESTRRITQVARHEYRAALRSRVLVILIAILVASTIGSVLIGASDYAAQLADYNTYRAAAEAQGLTRIAPSPLAVLALLRGALEYIEILGAIIAITLGYLSRLPRTRQPDPAPAAVPAADRRRARHRQLSGRARHLRHRDRRHWARRRRRPSV